MTAYEFKYCCVGWFLINTLTQHFESEFQPLSSLVPYLTVVRSVAPNGRNVLPARWSKDRRYRSKAFLVSLRRDQLTATSPQNLHTHGLSPNSLVHVDIMVKKSASFCFPPIFSLSACASCFKAAKTSRGFRPTVLPTDS